MNFEDKLAVLGNDPGLDGAIAWIFPGRAEALKREENLEVAAIIYKAIVDVTFSPEAKGYEPSR